MRRRHSTDFKIRVVLEALRERKTMAELASDDQVHPMQISQWEKVVLDGLPEVFGSRRGRLAKTEEALKDELFREIGRLKRIAARVELDWLKKWGLEVGVRRALVEPKQPHLSISRQCELLGLPRSSCYYEPCGEAEQDLRFKRLLDEHYMQTPFYGRRRMTVWLKGKGHEVNRKRVQRLMREMGWDWKPSTRSPRQPWECPSAGVSIPASGTDDQASKSSTVGRHHVFHIQPTCPQF